MKRDLLYCSNVQHRHILKNMTDFEEKDPVLVCCQQMIEMLLKAILFNKKSIQKVLLEILEISQLEKLKEGLKC